MKFNFIIKRAQEFLTAFADDFAKEVSGCPHCECPCKACASCGRAREKGGDDPREAERTRDRRRLAEAADE